MPRYMDLGFEQRRRGDVEAAIRSFQLAVASDSTYARAWFEMGYALLQMRRRADAIRAFGGGLRQDPGHVDALRQLGYLNSSEGHLGESIAAFDSARALGRDDLRDRLETGYVKQRLGDRNGALQSFAAASAAPDTAIANGGRRAIAAMNEQPTPNAATTAAPAPTTSIAPAGGWIRPLFLDVYAAPLYQTRFSNVIAQVVIRGGVVAENRTRISPYLSLRVSRDARSRGGPQPVIFSDNVAIPAVGVRVQPLRGTSLESLYLYAEAGPAIALVDAGQSNRQKSDLRTGGYYIGQWRVGAPAVADRTPLLLISDVYADASYYSRFDGNAIGFAQLRESLRLYEHGGRGVDLFARLWTVGDSRRVYYNNAVEIGAGIALYPESKRQMFFMLESLQGRYLSAPDPGVSRTYRDARLTLIISAYRWVAQRAR